MAENAGSLKRQIVTKQQLTAAINRAVGQRAQASQKLHRIDRSAAADHLPGIEGRLHAEIISDNAKGPPLILGENKG
jgi:hypothetical protein